MRTFWLSSTLHGGKFQYDLFTFITFYSGHCKKLAPEYAAAAEILAKEDPPQFLAKVDATVEKDVAEKYGIQGFPTLIFFK